MAGNASQILTPDQHGGSDSTGIKPTVYAQHVPRDELAEFWELEARDPEGHGPNLMVTRRGVAATVGALLALLAVTFAITWSIFGLTTGIYAVWAMAVLIVVCAVPIGVITWIRSASHARMEREAAALHAMAETERLDTVHADGREGHGPGRARDVAASERLAADA